MDRRDAAALALVVAGVALFAGGLFVYEVPDRHVHDARADYTGPFETAAAGDPNLTAIRRMAAEAPGPTPTVLRYSELSPAARELYREAVAGGGIHRTPATVGAPEFDYGTRTVTVRNRTSEVGHRYAIVHTNESATSMPPGYEDGLVDGFGTRTVDARVGSGHHLPRAIAVLAGPVCCLGGVYIRVESS